MHENVHNIQIYTKFKTKLRIVCSFVYVAYDFKSLFTYLCILPLSVSIHPAGDTSSHSERLEVLLCSYVDIPLTAFSYLQ